MAIIVYDFETTSKFPETTQAVQVAACVIDDVTLEIKDDIFNSHIRPEDWTGIDENSENCIWHAKNKKISPEEVIEIWKAAPQLSVVWSDFVNYCLKYNKTTNRSKFGAATRAGHNIINFDDIITKRIHEKYGKGKNIFHPRNKIDLLDWCYAWFENDQSITSYSMDNLRDYFGLSKDNAHDARKDILDCAAIIVRFMKLFRATAKKTKFKGAFANAEL